MSPVALILLAMVAWLAVIVAVVVIVAWRASRGADALRQDYRPVSAERRKLMRGAEQRSSGAE